jgi:translocation and assembly module TamA
MLLISTSAYAKVALTINGLEGELENNVEAYLSSIPESDYSTHLRFQSRLEKSMTEALVALGYYHPQFEFVVVSDEQELMVNINPGPLTTIKEMDVVISGEAESDADFANLINRNALKVTRRLIMASTML